MNTHLEHSKVLRECFIRANLRDFLRTRHPYDFIETYQALRHIFAYQLYYVNLGYWSDGFETPEAGRLLAYEVAATLGLKSGDRLLDVRVSRIFDGFTPVFDHII